MTLAGRVAVVTGATTGVGRGIVRELAQHGARVFIPSVEMTVKTGMKVRAASERATLQ
jgi:NAD(P)-dependent dehydrogenase (short-subunit alcohol dehydrogenase family)